jgi:primosomal replication protein N
MLLYFVKITTKTLIVVLFAKPKSEKICVCRTVERFISSKKRHQSFPSLHIHAKKMSIRTQKEM